MIRSMRYRLALDMGTTSIGWALIRLNKENSPCAIIRAGSRIFSDGRNPKDGSSLAVVRRNARSMRRRRDRLLKRKNRMLKALVDFGFWPSDIDERRLLERLNPYELRAKGLDSALTPSEFGRALFHINQRRGFKSNRKTDKNETDSGALKGAINKLREQLKAQEARTVGEWLYKRMLAGKTVRARYRVRRIESDNNKIRLDKSYDLYIDRAMVESEFDALWAKQAEFNPSLFSEQARAMLRDTLLFQRALKPVDPGRCTFFSDEKRAFIALPSVQRFRIYQDANHLRVLGSRLKEQALSIEARDRLVDTLEKNAKCSFDKVRKLLGLVGADKFSIEDVKRQELAGNRTTAVLSKPVYFGSDWFAFPIEVQDEIVLHLLQDESETQLIIWLMSKTGIDLDHAEAIVKVALPEGFGSLSLKAIRQILPELQRSVCTYDKAVLAAGFDHHSMLDAANSGEVQPVLPYYGIPLQRHVGFGSNKSSDCDEKRYGRIANPTVHIALNQLRLVVNAIIKKYGHPSEVIVELARDLKQSKAQRDDERKRQAENQNRNVRIRAQIAETLQISEERVSHIDMQKWILWEELSFDSADRRCPYSGTQIGAAMLLSDEVEIEHILPYSRTLDDSLNNKTVSLRQANRVKGNRTPWEAFGKQAVHGFDYDSILKRAELMPKGKRYRFGEDGYQRWLRDDADFLARALNDTRYLSKLAREYVGLICPQNTRVIPGRMTALLRQKFGLNNILGLKGEKNREDHRHHAVDACVIGVTDQGLLQRFAQASSVAHEAGLHRLVGATQSPWDNYYDHVKRAVDRIYVSHKPDHGYEGAMHNDTAYGLLGDGKVRFHKIVDGERECVEENLKVIEFINAKAVHRHGLLPDGCNRPYKGYKGDSNYCIEIVRGEKGGWKSEIVTTYQAYQLIQKGGNGCLRSPTLAASGGPLVMRLMKSDYVRLEHDGIVQTFKIVSIKSNGQIFMAPHNEANVDARDRNKEDPFNYVSKKAGSLLTCKARRVTVSPIGDVSDSGFRA